jgi:hypothetical protein
MPGRASLVVPAILALGVLAVPAARAFNAKSKPLAPRSASEQLRTELRQTQATLARATSELSRLRVESGGAGTLQLARLQQTLSTARAQLGGEAAHSTGLHSQLAAAPTPLRVAVDQVRREVAWAQHSVSSPRGQLVAQAAMDYTVGHVSTAAFGYLELVKGHLPGYRLNKILTAQAGICGQASWVFAGIVRRLGLRARSIVFSYEDPNGTPDGHTAVEVSYGGSWHFFDPTYGQFWADPSGDVLSVAQVRAGLGTDRKDLAAFTNVVESTWFPNDTWFITDPTTRVQIGTLSLRG